MKRALATILLSLLIAPAAMPYLNMQKRGVKAQKTEPTVDQILSRYKQSIGSKTVLENLNTLVMKGSYKSKIENFSGTFEFYAKSPDKYMSIIDVPDYGIEWNGYNGKTAWNQNWWARGGRSFGLQPRLFDLTKEIRLRKLYPEMKVKGKEKVGERDTYIIETMPNTIDHVYLYFDVKTGLLIRWRFTTDDKSQYSEGESDFYLEDYQEVNGLRLPFTIVCLTTLPSNSQRMPYNYTIKLTEVKINIPIEDSKFDEPTTPIKPQKSPVRIAKDSNWRLKNYSPTASSNSFNPTPR